MGTHQESFLKLHEEYKCVAGITGQFRSEGVESLKSQVTCIQMRLLWLGAHFQTSEVTGQLTCKTVTSNNDL